MLITAQSFFVTMFHIARAFKCGRTKATAIVKVIAQGVMKEIMERIGNFQIFSIKIGESTDITVYQQMGIMLRYFDNTDGKVCCTFFIRWLSPLIMLMLKHISSS